MTDIVKRALEDAEPVESLRLGDLQVVELFDAIVDRAQAECDRSIVHELRCANRLLRSVQEPELARLTGYDADDLNEFSRGLRLYVEAMAGFQLIVCRRDERRG